MQDKTNHAGAIVFEGAVHNESMSEVLDELIWWLINPRVQYAAGIKVQGCDHEKGRAPQMVYLAGQKVADSHFYIHKPIEFGAGFDCTQEGMPEYRVAVPMSAYFKGTPHAQHAIASEDGAVDLWTIRDFVFYSLDLGPTQQLPITHHAIDMQQVAIHWLDSNQDIQDISSWRGAHTRGRQDALKAMRLPYEVSAIQI